MKKKLLVMMIIAMMLLMAACGAKDATPSGGGSTPSGGSESSTGESVDLQIGQVITAAHGDKCFTQVTAVVQGDTVVAAFIDEYQFADGTQVEGVPNSDATEGFAAGYAEGQVLLSKRMEAEYYSANMAEKAGSTVAIDENYNAIQAAVNGLSIDDAQAIADKGEGAVDAVSGATLADTAGYISLIIDAAKNAK